ncbi:hypothetical protein Tco_1251235, partial [Tanacetum coccineum]
VQLINGTNYREKSTCPTTLLPPKHHVQIGRPKKKRKRSKQEDEPFVKDGKLSKKGRTITCESCRNIGHNTAKCKGQGGNNAEASGSASRQAQQTNPAIGQDGLSGTGSSRTRWTKRRVQTERISPLKGTPTQPVTQTSTNSQVPVTETRNAVEREMGYGIPTHASAIESDNGNFPMVDEEDLILKKISPMAEEIMVTLRESLEKNCISSSDSLLEIKITKNMSAVSDNGKFLVVDEYDLIFKKISPMAEEIMGLGSGDLRDYVSVVGGMDDGD